MPFIFKLFQTRVLRWLCVYCYSNWHTCSPLSNSISCQEYYSNWHTFQLCVNTAEQIILHIRYYSQRASRMNAQLQTFIKYSIHRFHFSTIIPSEYMTPENLAKVDDYLNITSRLKRLCIFSTKHLLLSLPVIACLVAVIEDNQRLKFKDIHQTPTTRYLNWQTQGRIQDFLKGGVVQMSVI